MIKKSSLLLVFIIFIFSCNKYNIQGHFILDNDKFQNIDIIVKAHEIDNPENNFYKEITLKNKSVFNISLKKKGKYLIIVDLDVNKNLDYHNYLPFPLDSTREIIIKDKINYINEPIFFKKKIKIKNYSSNKINIKKNTPFSLEWNNVNEADFYVLFLKYKEKDEDIVPKKLVIYFASKSNRFHSVIFDENKLIYDDKKFSKELFENSSFIFFKNDKIIAGTYSLLIMAYKFEVNNKFEGITQSDSYTIFVK